MQTPLEHLAARLSAGNTFLACYGQARAIAELGTDEAFEYLVARAADDGPVAEACGSALADLAEQTQSRVIPGLLQHPDSVFLAEALPQPATDAVIEVIAETLRKSTSFAVFRELGAQAQAAQHPRAPELEAIVEQRGDEKLLAAFRIGGLSAQEEFDTDAVVPYLQPGQPLDVWSAALDIEGAAELPEAEECLRRALESSDGLERDSALIVVGRHELSELADAVAVVAISDPDPQRRRSAIDTLDWLPECPEHVIEGTLQQFADRLGSAMAAFPYALLEALRDGDDIESLVDSALERVRHTSSVMSMTLFVTQGTGAALLDAVYKLMGSAMDLVTWSTFGPISAWMLPVTEALVELQIQTLGAMRRMAMPEVLEALMLLSGWPVPLRYPMDLEDEDRDAGSRVDGDDDDRPDEPWPARLQKMREAATTLAEAQLGHFAPPDTPGFTAHPLGRSFAWNVELRKVVARAQRAGQSAAEVTAALRSSQQREHHARKALVRAIGEQRLRRLQEAWEHSPYEMASAGLGSLPHTLGEVGTLGPRELPLAVKLFSEHNLQCALLSTLLGVPDTSGLSVVLGRLDSDCGLVYDGVQAVLIAVGNDALPAIEAAMEKTDNPMKLATMLEAARCIDAAGFIQHARRHLQNPHNLLAAVAARIIGEAGVPDDVPALLERMATGDEILGASAVWAIGELDPESHVDALKSAVVSPHPAVRDAAQLALGRCSNETLAPIIEQFTASGHRMRIRAAERLISADAWRDNPTAFRSLGVERRFPAYYPGPRLSVPGDEPWQWNIVTSTPGPIEHIEQFAPLVADCLELAEAWDFYTMLSLLPPTLVDALVDLCAPEQAHHALAAELLKQVLVPELVVVSAVHSLYQDGSAAAPADPDAAREAMGRAAAACTPDARRSLLDVEGALRSEGPDSDDAESDAQDDPLRTPQALLYLFVKEIAATAAPETLPEDQQERLAAIARWWGRLQFFADQRLGFLVGPIPAVEDLIWYVSHPDADLGTRRSILNYLLALVNHLPCEPETRRAAMAAIQDIFAPMLDQAAATLVARCDHSEQEAAAAVAHEFHDAVTDPELFATEESIISLYQEMPPVIRRTNVLVLPSSGHHFQRFWVEFAHVMQDILEDRVTELAGKEACTELRNAFGAQDHWPLSVDLQLSDEEAPGDVDSAVYHVVEHHTIKLNFDGLQQSAIDLDLLERKLNVGTETALELAECDAEAVVDQDGRRYLLLDPDPYLPQTGAEAAD